MHKQVTAVIVDDEPIIGDLIRWYLERSGNIAVVGVAQDGNSGLEMARTTEPTLMILDMSIPGGNGIELLAALGRCQPTIGLIAYTAHREYFVPAIRTGVAAYLLKPALDELVPAACAAILGRRYISSIMRGEWIEYICHDLEIRVFGESLDLFQNRFHFKPVPEFVWAQITDHYMDSTFSANSVARRCKLTPEALNALLKREVGFTFHSILAGRRLCTGGRILLTGDSNIIDVALEVGTSQSTLERELQRYAKMTPVEFRQRFLTPLQHGKGIGSAAIFEPR